MPSKSFPPISSADTKVLILGSLPGKRSLQEQRYYAQPRNSFWRIMGALFSAGPELAYDERTRLLLRQGIALWDVVASAERPGSLDSAIVGSSVTVNDFRSLFGAHRKLELVCFNGAKAAELYQRRVLPTLEADYPHIRYERLPSTSPAHAAMRYEEKLARWSIIKSVIDPLDEKRRV
jgi:hypoxanthine-DNA glycosylase